MAKLTDPTDLVVASSLGNLGVDGNIWLDTTSTPKTIKLAVFGQLTSAKEGVTLQALYSKLILLWETSTYNKFPFPMYVIDAKSGQFQFGTDGGSFNGWKPADDATRNMLRDGGWSEYLAAGTLDRTYVGIASLGNVNTGAQLYYIKAANAGAAGAEAPENFVFDDEVNEGVLVYQNGGINKTGYYKAFVREAGYKYKDSTLADTGQSATGAYTVNVLLSNEADLDIKNVDAFVTKSVTITGAAWNAGSATFTSTGHGYAVGDIVIVSGVTPTAYNRHGAITAADANTFTIAISSNPGTWSSGGTAKSVYDKIGVRYFSSAYSKDIDTAGSPRNFGIVIESGTHSGIDGSNTADSATFTTSAGGIDTGGYFTGGTLKIHEGLNKGTYTITAVAAGNVTVTPNIQNALSDQSFTIEPAGGLGASLQQIYTKVQYLLRQNSDIDSTSNSVTGKTAALLLNFVGSRLDAGFYLPTNPNFVSGTGVVVEGVTTAESNSIRFYDNTGAQREYPYSASGTLNFNSFLTTGGAGYYRMYITDSTTGTDDYGTSTAITVNDASGSPITGTITGGSIPFTFDYTNNSQGGRPTGGSAAPLNVTVVAGNKGYAKPVVVTGVLSQSKSISITLTAEQDRAYNNP